MGKFFVVLRQVLLVGLLVSIAGCKTLDGLLPTGEAQPPDWALNPPPNSASDLYGVGSRYTLDQAKNMALSEVAAQLGTQIQSQTEIRGSVLDGRVSESFKENIKANVASTEFSNYEVLKSEKAGDKYWVLVRVDKATLAKNMHFIIDRGLKDLDRLFSDFQSRSDLQNYKARKSIEANIVKVGANAMTLRTLDSSFNSANILDKLSSKQKQLDNLINSILIYMSSDKHASLLAKRIESELTAQDLKVVPKPMPAASTIKLSSVIKDYTIAGEYQTKLEVKVQIKDERGKLVATTVHKETGYSRISHQGALEQANLKIYEAMKQQGILESMGL